jgi:hypothetical protein
MWSDRLEDLERDLDRVEVLLEDTLVKQEADLGGRFGLLLGPLKNELGTSGGVWRLAQRQRACGQT